MKLAEYLADYLEDEAEKNINGRIPLVGLEEIIQQGLEAFASTEDVRIDIVAGNSETCQERIA